MASGPFDRVRLLRRAQRDLDRLPTDERRRLLEDLVRLASRTLPGEIKPIASLPGRPLQADAGRFRILHLWEGQTLLILTVFSRPDQSRVFRSLRKTSPRT